MNQQPQEEFRRRLESLFLLMTIVLAIIVTLWIVLGTFFMQLLFAGALFGGIFVLGAWMNDKSQARHTKAMLEATGMLSNLVIQTNRGANRIEAKQIEADAQMNSRLLERNPAFDEIEEIS